MGVKQSPVTCQLMQDHAFQCKCIPDGDCLSLSFFFGDTRMGDHSIEERFQTVTAVLTIARKFSIQYCLPKCSLFKTDVPLIGFLFQKGSLGRPS